MAEQDPKDKIGFGNPPKEHRFQKGQSGNPGGRLRGSKSWKRVIEDELAKEVNLKEQGVAATVTKLEALATRLVTDALNGNSRALGELLKQLNRHFDEPDAAAHDLPATDDDVRLLMKYAQRAVAGRQIQEAVDDTSQEF